MNNLGFTLWKRIDPLNRGLFIFLLANCVGVAICTHVLVKEPFQSTDLGVTARFLKLRPGYHDSWMPMEMALNLWRSHPEQSIYEKLFFEDKVKFQYPPTSLLILIGADKNQSHFKFLNKISWLLVAATVVAVILIYVRGIHGESDEFGATCSFGNLLATSVLVGCLAVTFYPMMRAYELGQIQVWINAFFAAAVWCWMTGRKKCCGLLIGTMCLVKPQYGVIVIWGLLRRQWGFSLVSVATGLAGLTASLWLFGLGNHLDYVRVLAFLSQHGESFYANQSINGLLNRFLFNGNNLKWEATAFAPYHPVVYYCTMASSLMLLATAWFGGVTRREKGTTIDFALMALAGTMASPIAWEHHYGILLPIYALLLPELLRKTSRRAQWIACLAVSYLLTSHFLVTTNRLAETSWNFVQSYVWFGALMVLGILFCLRRTDAEH